jgi:PAS domain S-box-containing protein
MAVKKETGKKIPKDVASHDTADKNVKAKKTARPRPAKTGTGTGATVKDSTGQKHADVDHYRLAALVESSDDAIIGKTLDGIITSWNTGAEKIYGYTANEVVGKTVSILAVLGEHDEIPGILEKIRVGERIRHLETKRRTKDGRIIDISLTISPIKDEAGQILGASTIAHDVTERKRVEKEAILAREEWERTFNAVPDLICILDSHYTIQRVNAAMAARLGVTPEQAVGLTCYRSVHGTQSPPDFCPHARSLNDHKEHSAEIYEEKIGGNFLVSCTPLLDSDGKLAGTVHVARDITERKKAENALRQLSDRLALATRAGGVGIWDYDVVNNVLTWDDQMFALYGITREQFGGAYEAWQAGLHPDDRARGDAEIQMALRGEKEFNTEFCVLWPDGSTHTIRALALVQRDAADKPLRMIGTNWDITERKAAEDVIRNKEEQIRLLLDSTAEAIYGIDMNGNCTFCNASCLRLLGYTHPRELLGKNMHWQIHHHRPDGSAFPVEECRIFRAFRLGEGTHVDDEVLWRADGTSFPAEYWSYPQYRDGQVIGAVVTFLDITERKAAEEILAHRTTLLTNLLDSIPDIVFMKNLNGVYLGCNPRFAEFVGKTREEIVGHTDYDLFFLAVADSFRENDRITLAQGTPHHNEEWIDYPDGHRELIDTYKAPLRMLDGTIIGLLGISRDITERKRNEQAIFEANKKLNMLNSITRHDVLNQITGLGLMFAVLTETLTDKNTLDYIAKAQDATERITRQIEFTREYQDIGVLAPQWQKVPDLILASKNMLAACPFEIQIDTGPLEIYADPLLNKVFYNLMENAVRHGEKVSRIRFFTRDFDAGLILVYEDNGVGIDEKVKKNLFKQGFGKHTGFGLYLMKEILAITGITIAETGNAGSGARFEITVPKGEYRMVNPAKE